MSVNLVNQTDASLAPIAGGTLYADEPIGTILPFGGSTVPNGFLLCNGAAVSRTTYAELFEVIETSFGAGDGSTTFNVPDLRGKVPVGFNTGDTEFNALGKTGGEKTHQLTITEMPAHSHEPKNDSSQTMTLIGDSNGKNPIPVYSSSSSYAKTGFTYLAKTGGSGAHNNLQPYNTVNYIIKATTIALPSDFESAVDAKCEAVYKLVYESYPTSGNGTATYSAIGSYTIPEDGVYQIMLSIATYTTNVIASGQLYLNSLMKFHLVADGTSEGASTGQTHIISLSEGDQLLYQGKYYAGTPQVRYTGIQIVKLG